MEKEQMFRDLYGPFMTLLPGTKDFFEILKSKKISIGLGTAADFTNADFTLDTLKIRSFFDLIVTSDLVPKGKPSPDVYLYAAERLQVDPKNCLVFEDTISGAEAGKTAGMKVGVITTMHSKEEWEAMDVDFIFSDYSMVDIDQIIRIFN
jgi:HAD superfamily hydrolase (TIGR01509 family)